MSRKFDKEIVCDACYEGKSEDGNLILIHEGEIELHGFDCALEDGDATQEFILKARDNKKFYAHYINYHGGQEFPDHRSLPNEIELIEVKKKRKTITIWEEIKDGK
jgi:hypothetical protein